VSPFGCTAHDVTKFSGMCAWYWTTTGVRDSALGYRGHKLKYVTRRSNFTEITLSCMRNLDVHPHDKWEANHITRWFKALVQYLRWFLGRSFGPENENFFSQIRHSFRLTKFCCSELSSGIPDDGGSAHLWNVGRQSFYTADNSEHHTRRRENLKSHITKF
jgi:hypothetical protein